MIRGSLLLFIFLLLNAFTAPAQFTLRKGEDILEISAKLSPYFNYRFYKPVETDHKKNQFNIDFAVLQLNGIYHRNWKYELQVNFRDAYTLQEAGTDDAGFLMDAHAEYSGLGSFGKIMIGYSKTPFTRISQVPIFESTFLQRPEMSRGEVFIRRDAGITWSKDFWNQQIHVMGGVYSGAGEAILTGDNDPSGNMEYMGRIEFDYPVRFRYREIDLVDQPQPIFSAGAGVRHAQRDVTSGKDYQVRTVAGEKTGYSADINIKWHGWTLLVEAIHFRIEPNDSTRLFGYPTNYFKSGGWIGQLNKYFPKIKSLLAVRYDEYNPSDLSEGDTRKNLCFAANYFINGTDAMIKAQYWYRLDLEKTKEPWANDQLRLGLQLQF